MNVQQLINHLYKKTDEADTVMIQVWDENGNSTSLEDIEPDDFEVMELGGHRCFIIHTRS